VSLYVSRKRGDWLLCVVVSRDWSQVCLIVMLLMMIEKKENTTQCDRSILILRDVHVDDILPDSKPAVSQPSGPDMIRCRNNYCRNLFVYQPQTRTKLARKGAKSGLKGLSHATVLWKHQIMHLSLATALARPRAKEEAKGRVWNGSGMTLAPLWDDRRRTQTLVIGH
jgi:hypothetical protein